ncbi:MAG: hypothetical protein ACLP8S_02245 [Solirubrobacteraceae bacterium]
MLANEMLPAIGGAPVAVYTFSRDHRSRSYCYGACGRDFIPVLTVGTPSAAARVNPAAIATIKELQPCRHRLKFAGGQRRFVVTDPDPDVHHVNFKTTRKQEMVELACAGWLSST